MKTEVASLARAWDWRSLPELCDWVVDEALRIQQIPAPTFHEAERAGHIAQRFAQFDLDCIRIDERQNVHARLAGQTTGKGLLIMAHSDTVFPLATDLSVRRYDNLLHGPGIGDNSMGLAAMLGLVKALRWARCQPACDLRLVATSCEEGLGDLRGAKAAFESLRSKISAVINLEGLALGHIYNQGTAVRRLRIKTKTDGGHSWLQHGRPSAINGLLELGDQIAKLELPREPRTTLNIGMIEGGLAINAIAADASLWLDLRSASPEPIHALVTQIERLVARQRRKGIRCKIELVGDRPSGAIAGDHPLALGALAALAEVGYKGSLEIGSTDGNVPLSQGCPAVTIGITRGGNAHRPDEFIEIKPVRQGMKQLIILALAAARYYAKSGRESW